MPDCPPFTQDPLDKRIITVNFATWLGSGPLIASVAWAVPAGIAEADKSNTPTTATNHFSGGDDGDEFEIACTITTDEAVPRDKTQRFQIGVQTGCNC